MLWGVKVTCYLYILMPHLLELGLLNNRPWMGLDGDGMYGGAFLLQSRPCFSSSLQLVGLRVQDNNEEMIHRQFQETSALFKALATYVNHLSSLFHCPVNLTCFFYLHPASSLLLNLPQSPNQSPFLPLRQTSDSSQCYTGRMGDGTNRDDSKNKK